MKRKLYTFPKAKRLLKGHEFRYSRENGRAFRSSTLVMSLTHNPPDAELKCGIVVSKKFNKRAVKRNRAKRLIREAFRHHSINLPPVWLVFIARKHLADKKFQDVFDEMAILFKEAELV